MGNKKEGLINEEGEKIKELRKKTDKVIQGELNVTELREEDEVLALHLSNEVIKGIKGKILSGLTKEEAHKVLRVVAFLLLQTPEKHFDEVASVREKTLKEETGIILNAFGKALEK
jgi:hypothetical protein